jgi:lactoylglutathione lyase
VSIAPCKGIAQIDCIALATNDLDSLRGFYRRIGGVAAPVSTGRDACALDFCGVRLEVFERLHSSASSAGDGTSQRLRYLGFALGSADAVDELSRILAATGHRLLEPPHRSFESGRYESVVLDPDGNRLKLSV